MDYFVQCGTTAIEHRNLPALADRLRGELLHTGYVREPTVVSNPLTRRLVLTARVEAGTPQTAITVAQTALLNRLRGHGSEYDDVRITADADARPLTGFMADGRPAWIPRCMGAAIDDGRERAAEASAPRVGISGRGRRIATALASDPPTRSIPAACAGMCAPPPRRGTWP